MLYSFEKHWFLNLRDNNCVQPVVQGDGAPYGTTKTITFAKGLILLLAMILIKFCWPAPSAGDGSCRSSIIVLPLENPSGDIEIGGWTRGDYEGPRKYRWYSVRLDQTDAPWTFSREDTPQRTIARLELMRTFVFVFCFYRASTHMSGPRTRDDPRSSVAPRYQTNAAKEKEGGRQNHEGVPMHWRGLLLSQGGPPRRCTRRGPYQDRY